MMIKVPKMPKIGVKPLVIFIVIWIILVLLISQMANAQTVPVGVPSNIWSGENYQFKRWVEIDYSLLTIGGDTSGAKPKLPAMRYWAHAGADSVWWYWDKHRWSRLGIGAYTAPAIITPTLQQVTAAGNTTTIASSFTTALSTAQLTLYPIATGISADSLLDIHNGIVKRVKLTDIADSGYIRNQTAFLQTANYKISGTGTVSQLNVVTDGTATTPGTGGLTLGAINTGIWLGNGGTKMGFQVAGNIGMMLNSGRQLRLGTNSGNAARGMLDVMTHLSNPGVIIDRESSADGDLLQLMGNSTKLSGIDYRGWVIINSSGQPTVPLDVRGTVSIAIGSVIDYADNAAALAALLPTGTVYRTGDILKIVH